MRKGRYGANDPTVSRSGSPLPPRGVLKFMATVLLEHEDLEPEEDWIPIVTQHGRDPVMGYRSRVV
jgi:hypothetical protein